MLTGRFTVTIVAVEKLLVIEIVSISGFSKAARSCVTLATSACVFGSGSGSGSSQTVSSLREVFL